METRLISIPPTISKVFELSIFYHIKKRNKSTLFRWNHRGLIKGIPTMNNIDDILKIGVDLKRKRMMNKKNCKFINRPEKSIRFCIQKFVSQEAAIYIL